MDWKPIIARLPVSIQDRLRKWHYERKLRSACWTDEEELGAVKSLVRPGDTVLDIGANFGLYTRFLSEAVGPRGTVHSFEPSRDMFLVLDANRRALGLGNVTCHHLALSDRSGEAVLRIPRRADGTLNHYEASLEETTIGSSPGQHDHVTAIQSLDDFCERRGIDRIDFIKCDVEGHEIAVLEGALRILRRARPTILIEVNEPLDSGQHGPRVCKLVESLRYRFEVIEDGRLRPRSPGEDRFNYVLAPMRREAPVPA